MSSWFFFLCTLFAQNNTYFPPSTGEREGLVMVQVTVRDGPQAKSDQIGQVFFAGQEIPLKPRDIYGNRGTGSFQLSPGKYELKWTVKTWQYSVPKEVTHKREVEVAPEDLWVQIQVVGDEAEIL